MTTPLVLDNGRGWRSTRAHLDNTGRTDSLEVFTAPDGHRYVLARDGQEADVIVRFARTRGLGEMRLTNIDHWTEGGAGS